MLFLVLTEEGAMHHQEARESGNLERGNQDQNPKRKLDVAFGAGGPSKK
jgi:hypothetical protein